MQRQMHQELEREPTLDELSDRVGLPPDPGLAPNADLDALHPALDPSALAPAEGGEAPVAAPAPLTQDELDKLVGELTRRMKDHAKNLEFEKAAELRDKVRLLQARQLGLG